jgi:16S rRNA (guanine527-N7)-methyltransferase
VKRRPTRSPDRADGMVEPAESLAELAARYGLRNGAEKQLGSLLDLLATDPLAPTAVRDPERILQDHLADSLVALELDEVRQAKSMADLGAGPGLPGLPLAIARPRVDVFLVESTGRKCEFLARAIEIAEVPNAQVVRARVEEWREGAERLDLVTARALAPLPVVAEYAAPLLRLGGALLAWRGRLEPGEEAATARAADELGLTVREPRRVQPYPRAMNRHLQLLVKTSPTPARFPRRQGMARKRPLGGQAVPHILGGESHRPRPP